MLEIIIAGRFFEVLIGTRTDPLLELLSKVALLYTLEPIFTIIYVANITSIWEKVMSILRAQIFRRVLIQKVNTKIRLGSCQNFILMYDDVL